jgi:hypothetical protein
MSNKFFGQYLLEKGVISKTQLLAAIDLQKASHLSLGQIAINKGYLTEEQAKQINTEQQRSDKRYGAIAVSMGLLKSRQVSEIFIAQQNARKFFGEILVEQKFLDKTSLIDYLEEHAELKKRSTLQLDNAIYAQQHGKLIADTINTLVRQFLRITKQKIQVESFQEGSMTVPQGEWAFSQMVQLSYPVNVGIMMDDGLIGDVAESFLDMQIRDNQAVCQDSVCEFLNIIMGNSLVGHCHHELTNLSPPKIDEAGTDLKAPFAKVFSVVMAAPSKKLTLFFSCD